MNRLAGLETEFGCLAPEGLEGPPVPERVRDQVFRGQKLGRIDVHDRDYDEPAGNGGFLYNGGRLYLDMGHAEYCTAECLTLADVVRYDLAGEEILQKALDELGLSEEVDFVKNNVDHYTGATFGCHENYLLSRTAPLDQENVDSLLTFLALRGLMTGAGRVGGAAAPRRYEKATPLREVPYQIMQRADFIQTEIYEWVQFNRALINARDEPLADPRRFRRLHLLLGDSNVLPFANALKIGATAGILDLLESNHLPSLALADPIRTMRELSHHPDGPWQVELATGDIVEALDLLEQFLVALEKNQQPDDRDGKWTTQAFRTALTGLRGDRSSLLGKVDWISKQLLLTQFVEAEKLDWQDPWLTSLDLEFHKTNPLKNLLQGLPGAGFAELGLPNVTPHRDWHMEPPTNTRAHVRSQLMHRHAMDEFYLIDWDYLQAGQSNYYSLDDPFCTKVPARGQAGHEAD